MGPARQAEANELLTVIQGNFEPNAEVNRSACPAHYRVHLRRDNEACLTSSSKFGTKRELWRDTKRGTLISEHARQAREVSNDRSRAFVVYGDAHRTPISLQPLGQPREIGTDVNAT